ncbi:MAG: restriction endonuclease subunit S [Actinobacteria bacterium]|nr:restriction endonuclease subunit S [Actinomycetota bacterium]
MAWEVKKLGEVCEIVNGGTPDTKLKEYWDGKNLWITPKDMGKLDSIFVNETERKITNLGLKNSSAKLLPINSIILSSRAPIGHLAINKKPMSTNQGCKGIVPKKVLDFIFLYYFLKKSVELLNSLGSGTTFKELSGSKLAEVLIPLPPISEQKRIVAILDEAFKSITKAKENAEKNLKNAKEIFESYLQSIFENKGEGGEEKRLGEVCELKHGFAFNGNDFNTDYGDDNPIVLTPGNFHESANLYFTPKNTKRYKGKVMNDWIFNKGDLVVVMTDLSSQMKILGKPAFIDHENILHNQRIGRFIFKTDEINKRFIYYYLQTQTYLTKIKETATGTMVKHTAPKRILENKVFIPTVHDQNIIVAKLDALSQETKKLEAIYNQKLSDLEELKKSYLFSLRIDRVLV